jgi:hypothetical protein
VTLIPGDGIGPECIEATRRIVEAAGAPLDWELADAGADVFKKGIASGVPQETMDSIGRTKVALKGPLETPVGFGEKSANVTLRKLFETYANVRPVREMPGVKTPYSGRGIDLDLAGAEDALIVYHGEGLWAGRAQRHLELLGALLGAAESVRQVDPGVAGAGNGDTACVIGDRVVGAVRRRDNDMGQRDAGDDVIG